MLLQSLHIMTYTDIRQINIEEVPIKIQVPVWPSQKVCQQNHEKVPIKTDANQGISNYSVPQLLYQLPGRTDANQGIPNYSVQQLVPVAQENQLLFTSNTCPNSYIEMSSFR